MIRVALSFVVAAPDLSRASFVENTGSAITATAFGAAVDSPDSDVETQTLKQIED